MFFFKIKFNITNCYTYIMWFVFSGGGDKLVLLGNTSFILLFSYFNAILRTS